MLFENPSKRKMISGKVRKANSRILSMLLLAVLLAALVSACADDDEDVSQRAAKLAGPQFNLSYTIAVSGQIDLTWPSVGGATSYNLYWDTVSPVTTAAPNSQLGIAGTSTSITGLTNGTTYYFIVTSVQGGVESTPSPEVATIPIGKPTVITDALSGQITVGWAPIPGAASVNFYWSTTSPVTTSNNPTLGVLPGQTVTGLTDYSIYYFAVEAVNALGDSIMTEVRGSPNPFPGALLSIPVSAVTAGGWTQCYSDTFDISGVSLASIQGGCTGPHMMLACRPTGNATLTLAGHALKTEMLTDTGAAINGLSTQLNGLDWYYNDSWSWGFFEPGDGVTKNSCDVAGGAFPNRRLCFHTGGGSINTGYRCGGIFSFTGAWERIFYTHP